MARRRATRTGSGGKAPAGWSKSPGGKRLTREVKTGDFLEAVRIITSIAVAAERLQHHPDLHITRWNRLRITTWSHDVGKLTERDMGLARAINEVLARSGIPRE